MQSNLKARIDARPDAERTCILLVEDEMLIRLLLGDELRDAGYHVVEACNADEALTILQAVLPDLIISDVRMPGSLDGLGLLVAVRNSHPTLPVIIMSGHEAPANAKALGASQFIGKPCAMSAVVKAVEHEMAKIR